MWICLPSIAPIRCGKFHSSLNLKKNDCSCQSGTQKKNHKQTKREENVFNMIIDVMQNVPVCYCSPLISCWSWQNKFDEIIPQCITRLANDIVHF